MVADRLRERLANFLRSSPRAEARDAQRAQQDEEKILAIENEERSAEASGNLPEVEKTALRMTTLDEDEIYEFFDIFVQIRIVTAKQFSLLDYTASAVKGDPNLTEEERENILQKLQADGERLKDLVEKVFQEETSFDSVNSSLKQLLGFASQARDMYFKALKTKKSQKRVLKDEKEMYKKSRRLTERDVNVFARLLNSHTADLKEEIKSCMELVDDTMVLLKGKAHSIEVKEQHIRDLMQKSGFPEAIGKEIIASYDETLLTLHRRLQKEIEIKRLELSNAEQKTAA